MNQWVVRLALLGALVCAGIEPIYGEFVYVVNNQDATVSGYAVNPATGALTAVPGSPFATVPTPRSVTVDPSGRFAYVAGSGVSEYTINSATGALTPIAGSPVAAGVAPLSVTVDPTGRFAYVADYGGNSVFAFTINPVTGALTPVAGSPYPAGSQSYSVAVDPTGRFVYVANGNASTVSAYTINSATGALTPVAGSPYATGPNPVSVTVDATGRFVYIANVNGNDVSAYAINNTTGALTPIAGSPFAAGANPQSVAVDPTGRFAYVANATDNTVSTYRIDSATGALTPVGVPLADGSGPTYVAVDPAGRFVYVANGDGTVSAYAINPATGALTAVAGSPFASGMGPISVAVAPSARTASVQVCKVAGTGVLVGSTFTLNVGGMLTTVKAGPAPGGACTAVVAVPPGPVSIVETLPAGGVLASVTTATANVVVNSNLAAGLAIVTVVDGAMTTAYFTNTSTLAGPGTGTAGAGGMCSGSAGTALFGNAAGAFQVRYASNLTLGDSVVNLTNTGASSTTAFPAQNGNLCVNVYTFSPDEQLISCCSCPVTPDGLASLSVLNDLVSNTLTPGVPTSAVIKLLATDPTTHLPAAGLAAYGTTLHAAPGAVLGTAATTETPFTQATLSAAEVARITSLCGFIQSNGSGFGLCRSCSLGGLGASKR